MSALVAATAPRPQTRAEILAELVVHHELCAQELRDQGLPKRAAWFESRAREHRATLHAVIRSER